METGFTPEQTAWQTKQREREGCANPKHHRNVYFKKVEAHQQWRVVGQAMMVIAALVFIGSAIAYLAEYHDIIVIMLAAIFLEVLGGIIMCMSWIPLAVGDVMYLRKRAEEEEGIYQHVDDSKAHHAY